MTTTTKMLAEVLEAERFLSNLGTQPVRSGGIEIDGAGVFAGYASVFGSVAQGEWGLTVIDPGAFRDSIARDGNRVKVLWAHDDAEIIGVPVELREDGRGLYVKARLSNTTRGRDAAQLARDKAVTDLSIGFTVKRSKMVPHPGIGLVRHVTEADLHEISLVMAGADPMAKIAEAAHAPHGWETLRAAPIAAQIAEAEAEYAMLTGTGKREVTMEEKETRKDWISGRPLRPLEVMRRAENGRLERLSAALRRDPRLSAMETSHLTELVEAEHEVAMLDARSRLSSRAQLGPDTDRQA